MSEKTSLLSRQNNSNQNSSNRQFVPYDKNDPSLRDDFELSYGTVSQPKNRKNQKKDNHSQIDSNENQDSKNLVENKSNYESQKFKESNLNRSKTHDESFQDDSPDDAYFQEDPLHRYGYPKKSGFIRFLINILTCCGIFNVIGENIKSILFGGLDGITTVFVSVATIYSSDVSILTVLIIGIAKLLSGSISMGVGDFMSSKAELDLIRQERKRELWECENFLQGEMDEMVDIYSDKGIKREIADKMVGLMSKNKEAFVDVMMVQELGLKANYDRWGPLKNGITNFVSFIIFGSVPLIIYVIFLIVQLANGYKASDNLMFFIDCGITIIALIAMGFLKSRYGTEGWFVAIITTLIVGVVAAGSGFLVALGLDKLLGFKE